MNRVRLFAVATAAAIVFIWAHFCFAGPLPQVLITEVLKDAPGSESQIPGGLSHEFVEFVNVGTRPLAVEGLFLTDGADGDPVVPCDSVIPGHDDCRYGVDSIRTGEIALILDPDYARAAVNFPRNRLEIAPGTILLTVGGDSNLGNGLAGNDGVMLYRGNTSDFTEIVAYATDQQWEPVVRSGKLPFTPAGSDGISVVLESVLRGEPRYGSCPTATSAGQWEGVSAGWRLEPYWGAVTNETALCTLAVLELGPGEPATTVSFSCFDNKNDGAVERPVFNLSSPDPRVHFFCTSFVPGEYGHSVVITTAGKTITFEIDLSQQWVPQDAVQITELYPRAKDLRPEWFELVNRLSVPLNLKGWSIETPERTELLAETDLVLAPGEYCVLTADSTRFRASWLSVAHLHEPPVWVTLDNYHDTLWVRTVTGNVADSIYYSSTWFPAWDYESLERVLENDGCSRRAWVVADRESPGFPNPSVAWHTARRPSMSLGPVPFTPDRDGRDDALAIRVDLSPGSSAEIVIYGFDGALLRRFLLRESPALWDGKLSSGTNAPVGPFFVVAQITGSDGGTRTLRSRGILWR